MRYNLKISVKSFKLLYFVFIISIQLKVAFIKAIKEAFLITQSI